jgi:hypothetical protein
MSHGFAVSHACLLYLRFHCCESLLAGHILDTVYTVLRVLRRNTQRALPHRELSSTLQNSAASSYLRFFCEDVCTGKRSGPDPSARYVFLCGLTQNYHPCILSSSPRLISESTGSRSNRRAQAPSHDHRQPRSRRSQTVVTRESRAESGTDVQVPRPPCEC